MPSSIRALKDSCVVIPCTFKHPQTTSRDFTIAWYLYRTTTRPQVYNSRRSSSVQSEFRDRTAFVGNMENRNCSLQINKVRQSDEEYYYTIINENNFRFWDVTVKVKVSDSPDELALTYPEIMSEGKSVTLSCSVEHTCPPKPPSLTWDQFGNKASIHHEELWEGRWRTVSSLNYSPSPEDHGKRLQCVATYPNRQKSQRSMTFNIRYRPQNTALSVFEKESVKEGDSVTLTCSSHSNPAVTNYSWYQGIEEEALQHHGQQITLQNVSWDGGPYYCRAHNALGTGSSPPLSLNVHYAPKGTHLVAPEKDPIDEGGSLVLRCETSSSNPAVTYYTWHKAGNLIVNQSQETLRIESVTAQDAGTYHCTAHNDIGSLSSSPVIISVTGTEISFTYIAVLGGVTGMIFLVLLGLVIFFVARNRKMQKPAARRVTSTLENIPITDSVTPRTFREEIPLTDEHLYWNFPCQRPDRDPEGGGHPAHSEARDPALTYSHIKKPGKKKQKGNKKDLHYATDLHSQQEDLHYSSVLHSQPEGLHYSTVLHSQPEDKHFSATLHSQQEDLHYSAVLHSQPEGLHYSTVLHSQPHRASEPELEVDDHAEYANVKH
ncbi:sialoadhesin-like [Rhinatrema bivittatum]|uniref:sialoadhesin-like n=1 Tax=Rhinatrema bivittatum TaxID=194408 RepID=UPI0011287972|nr:sialoadhesin-like [Rhinatrema bivittatum]